MSFTSTGTAYGSCLCTGACMTGSCAAYPNGRMGGCYSPFTTTSMPTFSEIQNFKNNINIEVSSIRQQVNAQEYTINHTQKGIEACFEAIEKIADQIGYKTPTNVNPFEFIAVDAKRRDDIKHIKKTLFDFYGWIINTVGDNRERSIAITKLEEAAMWLNKSISRRKGNEGQNEGRND